MKSCKLTVQQGVDGTVKGKPLSALLQKNLQIFKVVIFFQFCKIDR